MTSAGTPTSLLSAVSAGTGRSGRSWAAASGENDPHEDGTLNFMRVKQSETIPKITINGWYSMSKPFPIWGLIALFFPHFFRHKQRREFNKNNPSRSRRLWRLKAPTKTTVLLSSSLPVGAWPPTWGNKMIWMSAKVSAKVSLSVFFQCCFWGFFMGCHLGCHLKFL